MRLALSLVLAACSSQNDPIVFAPPNVHADVRGESSAACTLTFTNAGNSLTHEIAAPAGVLDVSAPTTRDALGQCALDSTEAAVVVSGMPPLTAQRTATCLLVFTRAAA